MMTRNTDCMFIGSSSFAQMREKGAYYVDKTQFIKTILNDGGLTSLYTRPRRFGKSLMLSTIASFFEMDYAAPGDATRKRALFEGLAVMEDEDFCRENLAQWPVIHLSLKRVESLDFDNAAFRLKSCLSSLVGRHAYLLNSEKLDEREKRYLQFFSDMNLMPLDQALPALGECLAFLQACLAKHFGKRVFTLIDEYDVPLQKARRNGYYEQMRDLIRGMFDNALKDNNDLQKGILTGCLRISKESVFTGLNQFKCRSVSTPINSEAFGFTTGEAMKMLADCGLEQYADQAKAHYDGYRFGGSEIWCPWDLVNFCDETLRAGQICLGNFWINTSGNDLIEEFIEWADDANRELLSRLLDGESAAARLVEDISFDELSQSHSPEMLLSLLYSTGYLTKVADAPDGRAVLRIPNNEIRDCFNRRVALYFSKSGWYRNRARLLGEALSAGDAELSQEILTDVLEKHVSVRDGSAEAFYHGLLVGLLSTYASEARRANGLARIELISNAEAGDGYADILLRDRQTRKGIVIELKKSEAPGLPSLEAASRRALEQIRARRYAAAFAGRRVAGVLLFGIAFSGKRCWVEAEEAALPAKKAE